MKFTLGIALSVLLISPVASAALTVSEQAQVRSFVATGQPTNAARVRALIARPDLTTEETSAAMKDALVPIVFGAVNVAFTRELVFGGPSAAVRPVLAIALTRALLARADAILVKNADLEAAPQAAVELDRIYGFIGADIANAGHPRGAAHDPQTGIPASSYDECVKALTEHIERNARLLKGDARLGPASARVRAQAELALFELANDVPTRRVETAQRLGLTGARRAMLVDLGILMLDSGRAENTRAERVRAVLDRLPSARVDVEAIYFGDEHPALRSRGTVLAVKTPLEATPPMAQLFSEEVGPGTSDPVLAELAQELSLAAVRRGLDNRADLRVVVERDVRAAGSDPKKLVGMPAADTMEGALAATVALLVIDAPRTFDLAFVRFLGGKPESAALVADALGAMAAFAPGTSPTGLTLALGRPKAEGGDTETIAATAVRLAPSGAVTAFVLDGHAWTIARPDATAPVSAVKRDGTDVTMAMLPSARLPATNATSWSTGSLVLARMQGTPRAGVAPGPHIRLVGSGDKDFDAIGTPAPGDDLVIEADLTVRNEAAGIAVRAVSGKDAFRGATLMFIPGPSPRIALVQKEDNGSESFLAAPHPVSSLADAVHVKLQIRGTKVEATIGEITMRGPGAATLPGFTMRGTVPSTFAHGDIALCAKKGAVLEAVNWSVRKL